MFSLMSVCPEGWEGIMHPRGPYPRDRTPGTIPPGCSTLDHTTPPPTLGPYGRQAGGTLLMECILVVKTIKTINFVRTKVMMHTNVNLFSNFPLLYIVISHLTPIRLFSASRQYFHNCFSHNDYFVMWKLGDFFLESVAKSNSEIRLCRCFVPASNIPFRQ